MDFNIRYEEMMEVDRDVDCDVNRDANCKPYVGMEFESIEASQKFWNNYALQNRFGDRIRSSHKDKYGMVLRRHYVCSREWEKAEDKRRVNSIKRANTRCNCGVFMKVSLNGKTGKYELKSFMEDHTHVLESKNTTHYFRAHRNINEVQAHAIDFAVSAGLGPKTTHRFMSLEAGGSENVGYVKEDIKSYLRIKRSKNMEMGEANRILEYMEEKSKLCPNFFHNMQLDCDGKITNIYWADSKMIVDYSAFGDVVMFDTTFGTNKEARPLGIFTDFNNHRETVVFGAASLYDETIESFGWLFNVFLKCHDQKAPIITFTDQDAAMKSALQIAMPAVRHCLCGWHITQNAMKNLAGTLNRKAPHLQMSYFLLELSECMYKNCFVEEFESMWKNMIEKYELIGNKWIEAFYEKKQQWSVAYRMNLFSEGVRSTQLSKSTNARVNKEMGGRLTMGKFFERFDMFLADVREKEARSDVHSRQFTPHVIVNSSILKHAAQVYTPGIYNLFSKEFKKMLSIHLNEYNQIAGPHVRIAHDNSREFQINFDPSVMTISCSCCRFEMHGYLCSHILRVFDFCRVEVIPDKYVLKRWTKHTRSGLAVVEYQTPKLTVSQIVQMLSSKFIRLTYQVAHNPEFVERIEKFISGEQEVYDKNSIFRANENVQFNASKKAIGTGVSGLKRKANLKGGNRKKRVLSCIEKSKGSQSSQKAHANNVQFLSQAIDDRAHDDNDDDDDNLLLSL